MSDPTPLDTFRAAFGLLSHLYLTPVLVALVRGRVPDHLADGPLSAPDVATRAGLNPLSVTRGLRALAAFGAFREVSPGVFANTAVSDLYRDHQGSLRNAVLFWGDEHVLKSAAALGHSMKTGESSFDHVFGESFWDWTRRHPEQNEMFNRALAALRSDEHQQIAAAYDWTGVSTVVDVGGGAGSLVAATLETHPRLRGVLVEQPGVLGDAHQLLSARGVRDRTEFVGGSFFDAIPATGEAWTLCQVLHDWPDAECHAILGRCRDAMRDTDRLLVIEILTVPCEPNPGIATLDMMMLLYFGEARQRTVSEYEELFRAARFELTRVLPTRSPFGIVEARPV